MNNMEAMPYTDEYRMPEEQLGDAAPIEVVALGGGTGLSCQLRGLRQVLPEGSHTTAIVTMGDDGGSSLGISEALKIGPVGDLRQAAEALLDDDTASVLRVRHDAETRPQDVVAVGERFVKAASRRKGTDKDALKELAVKATEIGKQLPSYDGHAYGNLILAAAIADKNYDADAGVRSVMDHLQIENADIVPVSNELYRLVLLRNGEPIIVGQSAIDDAKLKLDGLSIGFTKDMVGGVEDIELYDLPANDMARKKLGQATLIMSGVGSTLTSVLPAIMPEGIKEDIAINQDASVVAVPNIILQNNERKYAGSWRMANQLDMLGDALGRIDVVLANGNTRVPVGNRYVPLGLEQADIEMLQTKGADVKVLDLAMVAIKKSQHDKLAGKRSGIVHRSDVVAKAMLQAAQNAA